MGGGSIYNCNDNKRPLYNPFLNQCNDLSSSSIPSIYPKYDPSEFELDPVSLSVPELPPRPEAYRNLNQVRLIYTKSGFYLKSMDNSSIHGFFTIVSKSMENIDILVAWIPEYLIDPQDISFFISLDGNLAADDGYPPVNLNYGQQETMAISLKHIDSLYVKPPSLQEQGSIVITSQSGDVLKPLWYSASELADAQLDNNTWPGYDIIDILSCFNPMQSSRDMPYVHIVQHQNEIIPEDSFSSVTTETNPFITHTEEDPITKAIKDARWSLLERLSRITQYSRDTAAQVLEHPIARPILPLLPTTVQSFVRNSTVQNTLNEYQMATHYLNRWGGEQEEPYYLADDIDGLLLGMPELCGPSPIHTRRPPLSAEEWVSFFDEEGKLSVRKDYMEQLIFRGGLDSDIRIEAWKFLLGIYPWQSTFHEREAMRRSRADAYFEIKSHWFDHPEVRNTQHFQDEKHRIDKDVHRTDRSQEAFSGEDLPNPDPQMVVGTNENLETMKDILVTYNFYNTELGYVQGMSDLLAPLYVAMENEPMAFWTFTSFMDRVQSNFFIDQSGMHGQLQLLKLLIQFMDPVLFKHLEETETSNLFFCFRWLLVWFKREFEWEDVIRLWEVLWTNYLTDKMILFIALAVIDTHRKAILERSQFDEVLRYINDLTGHIPLEATLERAEILFYQFERKIRAMQHKKSMLEDQLQIRSIWNSQERFKIQDRISKVKVPEELVSLLPSPKEYFMNNDEK